MTLQELYDTFKDYSELEIRVNTYDEPNESPKATESYLIFEMGTGEKYISIIGR